MSKSPLWNTAQILDKIDRTTAEARQITMAVRVDRLLESACPGFGAPTLSYDEQILPETDWWDRQPDYQAWMQWAWWTRVCELGCSVCHDEDNVDDLGDYLATDRQIPKKRLSVLRNQYCYEAIEAQIYCRDLLQSWETK